MHRWKTRLLPMVVLLLAAAMVGGCEEGEPRIDASTKESTEESLNYIVSLMSEDDAQTFRDAVDVLMMHEMVMATVESKEGDEDASDAAAAVGGSGMSGEEKQAVIDRRLRERLHGRTADEVVEQVLDLAEERLGPDAVPESLRE